jgi:hypothetical protein
MKYMILIYGSQQDYDALAGKDTGKAVWSAADTAAMHAFMGEFGKELEESGELVEAHGLTAPSLTRRVQLRNGVPAVTDGPYPETQEVLAGFWIVECASFDRATELAARVTACPGPDGYADNVIDVRLIDDGGADLDR